MKRLRSHSWIVALLMLTLAALACSGSFSTANIADAYMTADEDGTQRTTTYTADQTFYAVVEVANAPEDTSLEVVWIAVNVEGEAPDTEIDRVSATTGDLNIWTFNLSNTALWPSGQYRADIYLNGELDQSLDFSVQ